MQSSSILVNVERRGVFYAVTETVSPQPLSAWLLKGFYV